MDVLEIARLHDSVAVAYKHEIYLRGIKMPSEEIHKLAWGETLLGWDGEGLCALGPKLWMPEHMIWQPDSFLEGVDPEEGNFGIRSALKLWLRLEAEGLMDTDVPSRRDIYEREFEKYS